MSLILVSIEELELEWRSFHDNFFLTYSPGYQKKNVHSLPQWYALAIVALALAISYASHCLLFNLPTALTVDDAV